MSYTNRTIHYGIPLPTSGDLVNLLDWNQSSEDIDAAIYGAAEAAQQAGSDIETLTGNITQLQTDLAGVQGDVTAIDGRVTSLEQTSGTLDDKVDDIADMITPREVTSAQSNIRVNVDELFRYNDVLYKCTVQINIGDTIVPNVNCTATNVETELANSGGGGAEIDDATTSPSKVWSSQKTNNELQAKANASNVYTKSEIDALLAQIGGGGMPAIDYDNPIHEITDVLWTATADCYLCGEICGTAQSAQGLIIDGTEVYACAADMKVIPITKIKAGQTVKYRLPKSTNTTYNTVQAYPELA